MNAERQPTTSYRTALDDIEISADVESAIAQMQASGKDTGSLTAQQRAGYVTALCRALRLNPLTNPVQFIRLNGKEVLYVTRTATDQLAAIHGLNRKTVRGPEIVDIAGTKVALCSVEVTLPNGRTETATATLPVSDPAMLYMKLETKAKRRGTLAILGLGLLAEEEAESIPGAERTDQRAPTRRALDVFRDALERDDTLAAIVVTWHAHCAALATEGSADDADADVAKWLREGGYHLTKSERQVLLARNWPVPMLALLDALAMQGAAPRVLRWRLDADIARAVEALPEHHAKTAKTICARTWCVLSEIETDRPNTAFAKAVEAAQQAPAEGRAEGTQEPAQPVDTVDPERAAIMGEMEPVAPPAAAVEPAALEGFYARIAEIELPGEAVAVWMKHRAALAPLTPPDRESAWKALCKKTEEVGKMKAGAAKTWLKREIAREDERRAAAPVSDNGEAA